MNLPTLIQAIRARVGRWNTPGLWERADFIVGARDDLTKLIAIVELQRAALEYYANPDHWTIDMLEGGLSQYEHLAVEAIQACDKLAGGE